MGQPNLAPKDPSERRRRNVPARGEWIDIDARTIDEPVLPERPPNKKPMVPFRLFAKSIWKQWRQDPVTAYWTESDIAFAVRTLALYDTKNWTVHAAEIRQREDRLALTPKGKRDLRFRITYGPGKEATKERAAGDDANVISMDERRKQLEHGA